MKAMIDMMNDDMSRGSLLKTTNEIAGLGGGSCFLKNTLELAHRLSSHGFELQTTLRGGFIHSLVPGFASRAASYLLSPSSTGTRAAVRRAAPPLCATDTGSATAALGLNALRGLPELASP